MKPIHRYTYPNNSNNTSTRDYYSSLNTRVYSIYVYYIMINDHCQCHWMDTNVENVQPNIYYIIIIHNDHSVLYV